MKLFKIITFVLLALSLSATSFAQDTSPQPQHETVKESTVTVYYFHYTRRCATCNAVESVTQNALKELYGPKVSFTSVNLDESAGEKTGKALKVSGQTLLIATSQKQINITSEGFMYARTKPEKLKEVIKTKVDSLL